MVPVKDGEVWAEDSGEPGGRAGTGGPGGDVPPLVAYAAAR